VPVVVVVLVFVFVLALVLVFVLVLVLVLVFVPVVVVVEVVTKVFCSQYSPVVQSPVWSAFTAVALNKMPPIIK
jgi:hypothetical protein